MNKCHELNPKVAIYGIGFVGAQLVKLVHTKGWQIVGAYNRAGEKVGKDVGRLAGLEEDLGLVVEDAATADLGSCGADIALIAAGNRLVDNWSAYQQFLSGGINVLCHSSEAYSPRYNDAELATQIDILATQNKVTFTGGGIWDVTRLWSGMMIAGPCVEIESLEHSSATEVVRQGVQFLSYFAVGKTVDEFHQQFPQGACPLLEFYKVPCIFALEKIGYTVTEQKVWMEPITWDEPLYCPELDREMTPGTVLGGRVRIDIHTQEGVTAHGNIEMRLFNEGETEEMRWRVNGKPSMEIAVIREDSGLASASSLFNRIPDVLVARPGIVEILEMGPALASTRP